MMKVSFPWFVSSSIISHYIRLGKCSWFSLSYIFLSICRSLNCFSFTLSSKDIWALIGLSGCSWLNRIIFELAVSCFLLFNGFHWCTWVIERNIWFKSVCSSHSLLFTLIVFIVIGDHVSIGLLHSSSALCHFKYLVYKKIYFKLKLIKLTSIKYKIISMILNILFIS